MIGSELASLDLLVKVLLRNTSERECSREHHVEKHTQGPHVNWFALVFVFAHDLRTHVAWCAAENLQPLVIGNDDREAEVDQLHHSGSLLDENVVQLYVSMYSVDWMQVCCRFCNLFEYPSGRSFSNNSIRQWFWILLKWDSFDIIGDDVDLLRCVDKIVKLDYAGVLQSFEDGDLALGSFTFHWVWQSILLIHLHCVLFLISFIENKSDSGIGSLPNDSSNVVGLQLARSLGTCWHMALVDGFGLAEQVVIGWLAIAEAVRVSRCPIGRHGLSIACQCSCMLLFIWTWDCRPAAIICSIESLDAVLVVSRGRGWCIGQSSSSSFGVWPLMVLSEEHIGVWGGRCGSSWHEVQCSVTFESKGCSVAIRAHIALCSCPRWPLSDPCQICCRWWPATVLKAWMVSGLVCYSRGWLVPLSASTLMWCILGRWGPIPHQFVECEGIVRTLLLLELDLDLLGIHEEVVRLVFICRLDISGWANLIGKRWFWHFDGWWGILASLVASSLHISILSSIDYNSCWIDFIQTVLFVFNLSRFGHQSDFALSLIVCRYI